MEVRRRLKPPEPPSKKEEQLEALFSEVDASYWLNDPALSGLRYCIDGETIRELIVEHLKASGEVNLDVVQSAWFWNPDGQSGPEIVIVQAPKEAA